MDPAEIEAMIQYLLSVGDVEQAEDMSKLLNSLLTGEDKMRERNADPFGPRGMDPFRFDPAAYAPTIESVAPLASRARWLQESGAPATTVEDFVLANLPTLGVGGVVTALLEAAKNPATPEDEVLGKGVRGLIIGLDSTGQQIEDWSLLPTAVQRLQDRVYDEEAELGSAQWGPNGYFTSTPSKAAELYMDRGLPLPTDTYNVADMMERARPGWNADTGGLTPTGEQYRVEQMATDKMRQAMMDDLTRRGRDVRDMTQTFTPLGEWERRGIVDQMRRSITDLSGDTPDIYKTHRFEADPVIAERMAPGTTIDDYQGRAREMLATDPRAMSVQKRVDKFSQRPPSEAAEAWKADVDARWQRNHELYGRDFLRAKALEFMAQRQGRTPLGDTLSGATQLAPLTDADRAAWNDYLMNETWQGRGRTATRQRHQENLGPRGAASQATLDRLRDTAKWVAAEKAKKALG